MLGQKFLSAIERTTGRSFLKRLHKWHNQITQTSLDLTQVVRWPSSEEYEKERRRVSKESCRGLLLSNEGNLQSLVSRLWLFFLATLDTKSIDTSLHLQLLSRNQQKLSSKRVDKVGSRKDRKGNDNDFLEHRYSRMKQEFSL